MQILQAIDKQTQHLGTFSRNFEELSDKIIPRNIWDQVSHEYHAEVQGIGPKLGEILDQSSTIQETVYETSQQLSVVASQNSSILSRVTRSLFIVTSGMLTLQFLRRKVVELVQSWSAFTEEMRDFTKQKLSVDFIILISRTDRNLADKFLGIYMRLSEALRVDCHLVLCYRVFSSKMHGATLCLCSCRYFITLRLAYKTWKLVSSLIDILIKALQTFIGILLDGKPGKWRIDAGLYAIMMTQTRKRITRPQVIKAGDQITMAMVLLGLRFRTLCCSFPNCSVYFPPSLYHQETAFCGTL